MSIFSEAVRLIVGKEFVTLEDSRSQSENHFYISAVKKAVADYSAFKNFKRNPKYTDVLEHVSPSQGKDYLNIIKKESPKLFGMIESFKINDLIGNPRKCSFEEIGKISPTTLRYIKVASDLESLFGSLDGFDIAEIGGGYGGQLLILDQIWRINSHNIFDLDPVLLLISKYFECHILRGTYSLSTLNRASKNKQFDLIISNYAFSELPKILQLKYIEKIVSSSKRGYLTMNSIGKNRESHYLTLDELKQHLPPFQITEERPLTAPNNYIIYWGKNT